MSDREGDLSSRSRPPLVCRHISESRSSNPRVRPALANETECRGRFPICKLEHNEMVLAFVRAAGLQHCRIRFLRNLSSHDVPELPGAYVLMSDEVQFEYPMRSSRVFYIGQSENLKQRLSTHCAAVDRRLQSPERIFRPRYEYAAAFGVKYCYVVDNDVLAEDLEVVLFVAFAKRYRGYPVANGSIPNEVRTQFNA